MSLSEYLAQCDRETGLNGSLYDFLKLVWPQVFPNSPFVDNWHYGLLCEHYEAVYRGEIRELVVNLPPGGGKSSLTCVVFPAWVWAKTPQRSIIHAAYGQKLVRRDAEMMLKLIHSKWWQRRWGDRFAVPTVPAVELIKNSAGGFRLGTTPGGEVTGWHANYQLLDDPNKPEELTPVGLQNTKDWLARTLDSRWRRPPEINGLICIMQRLHCDDLAQTLLDRGAMHVCLPATFDPARRTVTTYGKDPRQEKGELMDPIRLPQHLIDTLRRNLGPINAAAQLDQNPVPEGGAVFAKKHLRFWSTNPKEVAEGVFIPGLSQEGERFTCIDRPPRADQRVDSWDCAFKDEEDNDFVAGQSWERCGSRLILSDQMHDQMSFGATVKAVTTLRARRKGAVAILVEDKANGPAVISTLTLRIPGLVPVDPEGGKYSRAASTSAFFEAGNVYLPSPNMPGFYWVAELLTELLTFPRAKNDDRVDALTQAIIYLTKHANYLADAMKVVGAKMRYQQT